MPEPSLFRVPAGREHWRTAHSPALLAVTRPAVWRMQSGQSQPHRRRHRPKKGSCLRLPPGMSRPSCAAGACCWSSCGGPTSSALASCVLVRRPFENVNSAVARKPRSGGRSAKGLAGCLDELVGEVETVLPPFRGQTSGLSADIQLGVDALLPSHSMAIRSFTEGCIPHRDQLIRKIPRIGTSQPSRFLTSVML